MNILFNTESIHHPLTGIGNYSLNLLNQLNQFEEIQQLECFSGDQFFPVTQLLSEWLPAPTTAADTTQPQVAHAPKPNPLLSPQVRSVLRRIPFAYQARAWLRNQQLKRQAQRRSQFIYHEPNFILKAHNGPCVATIHDLSFIHYPQYHPAERVAWIGGQLPKTLARADFLITPSEVIRQELIQDHGVPADKVRCIYLGAAECFQPYSPEQTQSLMQQHGLTHGQYLLFVASLEPRKGIDVLLDAWCSLPAELRQNWPLVLAGAPGWKNQALQSRIEKLKQTHGLKHLSFVPAQDLPLLYAGAAVFLYPAFYEGFGLPVLEAMQSGVPVISTAGTSMAEFAGESIVLSEQGNATALAEQLQKLLENPQQRLALSQKGLSTSQQFSWQRCAQETLAVYQQLSSQI